MLRITWDGTMTLSWIICLKYAPRADTSRIFFVFVDSALRRAKKRILVWMLLVWAFWGLFAHYPWKHFKIL